MKAFSLSFSSVLIALMLFSACDQSGVNRTNISVDDQVDLDDGFYYLNGESMDYAVIRKGHNETYILNPEPIFESEDYETIIVLEEENGKFSLDFNIDELNSSKWADVLRSSVHYIGFVHNKELRGLIKIKGENARDRVFLKCISPEKAEAEEMLRSLMN